MKCYIDIQLSLEEPEVTRNVKGEKSKICDYIYSVTATV